MGKSFNCILKAIYYLVFVLLISSTIKAQDKRQAVIEQAKKDVGTFEGKSNTGAIQKFAKFWNEQNPKERLSLNSPYCGLAVNYWYNMAGIKHNIKFSPRALNFYTYCQKPVAFWKMSITELAGLKKGGAVVYKTNWGGNHVGLFDSYKEFNIYTYEANTSTGRSVNRYSRTGEGVFYLKTSINNRSLKPLYYCDCINQSKSI